MGKNDITVPASSPSNSIGENMSTYYKIPVFLSTVTPYNSLQHLFLNKISEEIIKASFAPRTLGSTEKYSEPVLTSIRRMVYSSFGMLSLGFHRFYVKKAISKPGKSPNQEVFDNFWLTSPYAQIEPAMAYQYGLPVLLLLEQGENRKISQNHIFGGIYEANDLPFKVINFKLEDEASISVFFDGSEWQDAFGDWAEKVRMAYSRQTEPLFRY